MIEENHGPWGRPLRELLAVVAVAGIIVCLVLMQLEIRRLRAQVVTASRPATAVVAMPRWEYLIETPNDDVFTQTMTRLGSEGWELVSARRSTSDSTAHEMIFKRLVVEKTVASATAAPPGTPPAAPVSTAEASTVPALSPVAGEVGLLQPSVVSARIRVMEETKSFGRLAYILTVAARRPGRATIDVKFKDGSGFVVDTDFIPNVTLHEGLNEFSDEAVMRVENLRKIVKLDATITPE